MNLKQYITLYKRVFDSACCQQIIDRSNQSSHTKHTWYNPYREVESLSDDLEPLISYPKYPSYIDDYIRDKMKDYTEIHKDNRFSIDAHTPLRINKYEKGNIMDKHVDHIQSIFDGKNKGVPILSFIIGLNDNYKGGEVVFFTGWNEKKYRVEKGDMLIFPSCFLYPHRVESIKSGIRYSAVGWGF